MSEALIHNTNVKNIPVETVVHECMDIPSYVYTSSIENSKIVSTLWYKSGKIPKMGIIFPVICYLVRDIDQTSSVAEEQGNQI